MAAAEGVFPRRIEFHPARQQYSSAIASGGGGGFRIETLNPDPNCLPPQAPLPHAAEGKKEKASWELVGLDPELSSRINFQRIGAGLANLGNTCFLNSVLQCLTYTEPFAAYLQSGKHKSSCRAAGFCALCAFQNHVTNALRGSGKIVAPYFFVKNLRSISRNFRNSRQEDAHELMVNLLESMHKSCLPSGVPSESPNAYEKSLVHKIFGGRLRSQVRCMQCSYCSNKFDPFLDLSLEIVNASSVFKALENFTAEEVLDGGEKQYQCQQCRKKVVAKKRLMIDKPPYVLTVHLKRFSAHLPGRKIDKRVDFQPTLNLKRFVSDSQDSDLRYSLYGVLVHAGWNTHSGHYYCFVRTSSGMWHSLDDNQVSQVSEKTVLAQKAYMLFYVRDRSFAGKNSAIHKNSTAANVPGNKMVSQSVTYLNGVVQKGMPESQLRASVFASGTVKTRTGDGHYSILGKVPTDQSCKDSSSLQNDGNINVVLATDVQNNSPLVLHKVPGGGIVSDILPTSLDQSTSEGHREIKSSGDHGVDRKDIIEEKADGISNDPVKDTSAASKSVHLHDKDAVEAILKSEDLPSQLKSPAFSKVTLEENNTRHAAQVIMNQVNSHSSAGEFVQSNASSNENMKDSVTSDQAKDMILNNTSVGTTAEYLVGSSAPKICNSPEKVISKSKKSARRSVVNLYFGCKQLNLLASKIFKKKKLKKTRRQPRFCKDILRGVNLDDSDEQKTSTSETVGSANVERKPHSKKRSRACANADDVMKKLSNEQSGTDRAVDTGNLDVEKSDIKHSADQPKMHSNSAENQINSRVIEANDRHSDSLRLLTRGLTQITVPRWDSNDTPNAELHRFENSRNIGVGYLPDEWDEEYDRGRRKKIKQSKQDFGGPNPFQETSNVRSRQKTKLKGDQARWGNQPFRI